MGNRSCCFGCGVVKCFLRIYLIGMRWFGWVMVRRVGMDERFFV